MALPATHIKFALDLANLCDVSDNEKFISGTLYPDSRYISGIDRTSTHYNGLIDYVFSEDDFMNGWALHFICDKVQRHAFSHFIPEFIEAEKGGEDELYILASALKIIQDVHVLQKFHVLKYVKNLQHIETHFNEQIDLVEKYYQLIQDVYAKNGIITVAECLEFWVGVGLAPEKLESLREMALRLSSEPEIIGKMNDIYTFMLHEAKKIIQEKKL